MRRPACFKPYTGLLSFTTLPLLCPQPPGSSISTLRVQSVLIRYCRHQALRLRTQSRSCQQVPSTLPPSSRPPTSPEVTCTLHHLHGTGLFFFACVLDNGLLDSSKNKFSHVANATSSPTTCRNTNSPPITGSNRFESVPLVLPAYSRLSRKSDLFCVSIRTTMSPAPSKERLPTKSNRVPKYES